MSYLLEDINYLKNIALELNFKNKSYLISGATGMIGKVFVSVVSRITHTDNITLIVKDEDDFNNHFNNSDYKFLTFDNLNGVSTHFDYIIHLASPTSSVFLANNPVEVIDFIYASTVKLLNLSKKFNSKMLYISSMEVYGEIFDDAKKSESELGYISLESTRSSYPEAKRLCELLIKSYATEYGVCCYTARLAQTFGAGTSINDPRVFGYFARCAINNENIVLKTKGDTFGNYCYLADTIASFFYILEKGIPGDTYNVVSDNSRFTIFEMANLVINNINHNISLKFDIDSKNVFPKPTQLNMDNSKLKSLGWRSQFNIIDMYKRMIG